MINARHQSLALPELIEEGISVDSSAQRCQERKPMKRVPIDLDCQRKQSGYIFSTKASDLFLASADQASVDLGRLGKQLSSKNDNYSSSDLQVKEPKL